MHMNKRMGRVRVRDHVRVYVCACAYVCARTCGVHALSGMCGMCGRC